MAALGTHTHPSSWTFSSCAHAWWDRATILGWSAFSTPFPWRLLTDSFTSNSWQIGKKSGSQPGYFPLVQLPHSVAGRRTPSRARKRALGWHSEMNCLGRHTCWQSKSFYRERPPGGEQEGKGTQENRCAVSGWWWDWFPGGLWPIVLIHSTSWWCTHRSAKKDANEKGSGSWLDTRCRPLTFPELFQLVVPGALPGPPF